MPEYAIDGMRPSHGDDVWIAPSADVIGDVRLGSGSSVWFGAVIRADNTPIVLGASTNVQDGAMLHSDPGVPLVVGSNVTIGHHAILHGCTIHDNVLVGMGAAVLNGAVIGKNCLVGARALVTENKVFPPGSLIVGSPAKAVRELTVDEIAAMGANAKDYALRSRRYHSDLRIVRALTEDASKL